MTDLQIYESLCTVIEQQAALIRELITRVKEADAISGEAADRLQMLDKIYDEAIGDSKP